MSKLAQDSLIAMGARDRRFYGWSLARLRLASNLTPEQQAARLGLSLSGLAFLSMCATPAKVARPRICGRSAGARAWRSRCWRICSRPLFTHDPAAW
jgi:hypothetical protein